MDIRNLRNPQSWDEKLTVMAAPQAIAQPLMTVFEVRTSIQGLVTVWLVAIMATIVWRTDLAKRSIDLWKITLAAVLAGPLAFYAARETVRVRQRGFERVLPANHLPGAPLGEFLGSAQRELLFYGVNFEKHATNNRSTLVRLLQDQVRLRYLVFDPTIAPDVMGAQFRQTATEFEGENLSGLRALCGVAMEAGPALREQIHIKVTPVLPTFRLYVSDAALAQHDGEGRAILVTYMPGRDSPDAPAYFLRVRRGFMPSLFPSGRDAAIARPYIDHVNELWSDDKRSETLRSWLARRQPWARENKLGDCLSVLNLAPAEAPAVRPAATPSAVPSSNPVPSPSLATVPTAEPSADPTPADSSDVVASPAASPLPRDDGQGSGHGLRIGNRYALQGY